MMRSSNFARSLVARQRWLFLAWLIPIVPAGFAELAEAAFRLPVIDSSIASAEEFERLTEQELDSAETHNSTAKETLDSSGWIWQLLDDDDEFDSPEDSMLLHDDDDLEEEYETEVSANESEPDIPHSRSWLLQLFDDSGDLEKDEYPSEGTIERSLLSFGDGHSKDDTDMGDDPPTGSEQQFEDEKSTSTTYFSPRRTHPIYYITLGLGIFLLAGACLCGRRMRRMRGLRAKARIRDVPCEFTEFVRASPGDNEAPEGGFFHPSHCPPMPRATFQVWYTPDRASIYSSLAVGMPWNSIAYAFNMCLITCLMWSALYLLSNNKVLKRTFVTFHGAGEWYNKKDNFWKIGIKSWSSICKIILTPIAFFLLYFIKQRLRWFDKMKIHAYDIQSRLESCAFMISAFLSGEDLVRQRARHDIYRWLTVAHFLNHRGLSPHLAAIKESALVQCGLLTQEECDIVGHCLHTFDREPASTNRSDGYNSTSNPWEEHEVLLTAGAGETKFSVRTAAGANLRRQGTGDLQKKQTFLKRQASSDPFQSWRTDCEHLEESEDSQSDSDSLTASSSRDMSNLHRDGMGGEAQHARVSMQTHCKAASRARDLCLWWVELRVQACVKQKLMDKDKLKKILGAIWFAQRVMEVLVNESTNKQLQIQVLLARAFVDMFICLTPFLTLSSLYRAHIFTLLGCMLNTFVIAFFYDAIFEMMTRLWDCFGVDTEDLHLDPILVLTERSIFANLAQSEKQDIPSPFAETWATVKDLPSKE